MRIAAARAGWRARWTRSVSGLRLAGQEFLNAWVRRISLPGARHLVCEILPAY